MGGAVDAKGNVGNSGVNIQNEHAEWNIYIDPVAANIVFKSGIPIILIPLDATEDVPVTRKFYVDSGGFQFWDSITSATSTDQSIVKFEELNVSVVEEEGPESGRLKQDANGAKIKVAMSADPNKFEGLFLTVLNWTD